MRRERSGNGTTGTSTWEQLPPPILFVANLTHDTEVRHPCGLVDYHLYLNRPERKSSAEATFTRLNATCHLDCEVRQCYTISYGTRCPASIDTSSSPASTYQTTPETPALPAALLHSSRTISPGTRSSYARSNCCPDDTTCLPSGIMAPHWRVTRTLFSDASQHDT